MTDSDRSMNEVPGLIAERRRYEGWLAALDARRESTPAHVFERVQADYRERLQRVAEQLATHRQAIEEARASVQSRLSLLEAEERLRRDERAELELRAHVGELVDDEAEKAFRAVDDALATLVSEKNGLEERVGELDVLLEEGAPTPPKATTPASTRASTPAKAAAPASKAAQAGVTEPELFAAAEPPSGAAAASATPRTPTGQFDELAFLSSVVGSDDDLIIERDTPPLSSAGGSMRDDSLLAGLENKKRPTGEHPLASNVAANTPIVLRQVPGSVEQSKTLKCGECGGLNYPTEWYCERCGAELTAL